MSAEPGGTTSARAARRRADARLHLVDASRPDDEALGTRRRRPRALAPGRDVRGAHDRGRKSRPVHHNPPLPARRARLDAHLRVREDLVRVRAALRVEDAAEADHGGEVVRDRTGARSSRDLLDADAVLAGDAAAERDACGEDLAPAASTRATCRGRARRRG
jgi:hypothetical protein